MHSVDDYIESLPDEKRLICEKVRMMILSSVPGVEERLSFKIPFYHYFGMFMYMNNTKEGIDVAFCRGKDLAKEFSQLAVKQRAIVATVTLRSLFDINRYNLRELIAAGAAWNEEAKRNNIPMVKSARKKNKQ